MHMNIYVSGRCICTMILPSCGHGLALQMLLIVKYCLKPVRANTRRGDLANYLQLQHRLEMDTDVNALEVVPHMAVCKVVPTHQEVSGDTFDAKCNAIQMERFTPLNQYFIGRVVTGTPYIVWDK